MTIRVRMLTGNVALNTFRGVVLRPNVEHTIELEDINGYESDVEMGTNHGQ